jgi:carboxymethylenebutenolidase
MTTLTPYQQTMLATWQRHGHAEFVLRDPDAAIATMSATPYIMGVPLGQCLYGREAVHSFYAREFLPKIPPDFEMSPICQVIGADHIVDEFVVRFTHTVEMPWMVPGVRPTERRAEVVMVALVGFDGDKMAYEHLMWDHTSMLAQLGIVAPGAAGDGRTSAAQMLKLVGRGGGRSG